MTLDYREGLRALKQYAKGTDWYSIFETLSIELLDNLHREDLFGSSEQLRSDRFQVVHRLNELALTHQLSVTFTELCQMPFSPIVSPISLAKETPVPPAGPNPLEVLAQPTPAQPARYGTQQRWAVLVGVNTYEDSSAFGYLDVCSNDVRAIRAQLLAGGFRADHIVTLIDGEQEIRAPKFENILATLESIAQLTGEDDLFLFYFSGHGATKDNKSYLIPRNGRQSALRDTAVSIERVKEIMYSAQARARVIILDACHSGSQNESKTAQPMSADFIRHVFEQATGFAIYSSCQQDQLSYLWHEKHCSVFTYYLLGALQGKADQDRKGFVTVYDMNKYVTYHVKIWASQQHLSQTPLLNYLVSGDILLVNYGQSAQPAEFAQPDPPDESFIMPDDGADPRAEADDRVDPEAEADTRLEQYLGNLAAFQQGQVHQSLLKQLTELGARPKENVSTGPEDLLARYKEVPLHAVFLYTSEDHALPTYILEHMGALDSLSDDICDIHIDIEQFQNKEDGYDLLKRFDVIRESNLVKRVELPGLFFWDLQGASEFLPFGSPLNHTSIKQILRALFDVLSNAPTIAAITHFKQRLKQDRQRDED